MRMKWSLRLAMITVLFFIPILLGMGVIGDSPTNKIPVPDKKYTVTFIDQMDVVTGCSEVSIEGNTFIDGKRGEGTYAIAFDRIRSVLFRMKERELLGVVQLRDGSEIELVLNKDRKAYGKTEFGTFQIKLSNLKKMIFPTK
jgi:hypothetical protein